MDIQAKLYSYILQENLKKDPYFSQFIIKPYQFIVINRRTLAPIVWVFNKNFETGDLKDEKGNIYRDWRKILFDLAYYLDHPETKYSIEVEKRGYIMTINNLTKYD